MGAVWPLVGRESELAAIGDVLLDGGAALLVGPGGVGQSRLAVEAAAGIGPAMTVDGAEVSERLTAAARSGDREVVIVERAEAVDDAGLQLLRGRRSLLVMREDRRPSAAVRAAVASGAITRIDVAPLAADALDAVIDGAFPGAVSTELRRWLQATSRGHPLLLRELLTDGIERGAIVVRDGTWTRDPVPTPLTPRLLDVLVEHRSTLTATEWLGRELLVIAGTLGRDQLVAFIGAAAVELLEARGLVRTEQSDNRTVVTIPSPAQARTVRGRIGPMAARTLRHRLIELIEATGARRTVEDGARVAVWRAANHEAADWQSRAVSICFSLAADGRLAEADAQAEAGRRIALWEGDGEGLAAFGTALELCALARGRPALAMLHADEAIRSMLDVDRFGFLGRVLCDRVIAAAHLGDAHAAGDARRVLDAAATPLGPIGGQLRARAWALVAAGDIADAVAVLDAHRSDDDLEEVARLHDLVRLGRPDLAVEGLRALAEHSSALATAIALEHANALAVGDGTALARLGERLAGLGADLLAAEAWAEASTVHLHAGDRPAAITAAARSRALAAACPGASTPALALEDPLASLTAREREVASLAARGCTDRQIAEMLIMSVRTAESHLAHVYTKLGISGRAALAALVPVPTGSSAP
jgi:DNA-binding CsgD family transcriptional regulator